VLDGVEFQLMPAPKSGLDKPQKFFLWITIIGLCLTVVVNIFDGEGFRSMLTPSFFILVGLAFLILLEWLSRRFSLKPKWLPDAIHSFFIFALMAAILKDSWPKIFHFFTHQTWLLLGLKTTGVVLLVFFYFLLKARSAIVCAVIEIMVGVFLCGIAITWVTNERSLKTLYELIGTMLILVGTFEHLQSAVESRRNKSAPPPPVS
jgi:hypothetical protein